MCTRPLSSYLKANFGELISTITTSWWKSWSSIVSEDPMYGSMVLPGNSTPELFSFLLSIIQKTLFYMLQIREYIIWLTYNGMAFLKWRLTLYLPSYEVGVDPGSTSMLYSLEAICRKLLTSLALSSASHNRIALGLTVAAAPFWPSACIYALITSAIRFFKSEKLFFELIWT